MEVGNCESRALFDSQIPDTPEEYLQLVARHMKFEHQWKYLKYTSTLNQIRQFLRSNENSEERIVWIRDNALLLDKALRCACHQSDLNVNLQNANGKLNKNMNIADKAILR